MNIQQKNFSRNLISLKTSGYELKFYLVHLEDTKDKSFNAKIEFSTTCNASQKISVVSEKTLIKLNDLIRLKTYFKEHMINLASEPEKDSYIFVDYTLAYQIHAFCGNIDENEGGCFSILTMVNIGKTQPTGDSTYIGGESTITFKQVEDFIISIDDLISPL
jgi:hypothetical protein